MVLWAPAVSYSSTNLISNGGLTGVIPSTNGTKMPSVPPGWEAGRFSIDMYDSGGIGYFGEQLPSSPGGTQIVTAVGGDTRYKRADESFHQTISGLQRGEVYLLEFYQANIGLDSTSPSFTYESDGFWEVQFNGHSFSAPLMPFIGFGVDQFSLVSTTFTAESTVAKLEFIAHDDLSTDSIISYLAIDDISLRAVSDVPEPSSALTGFLIVLCGLVRRRR